MADPMGDAGRTRILRTRTTTPTDRRRHNTGDDTAVRPAVYRAELDAALAVEAQRQDSERRAASRDFSNGMQALLDRLDRMEMEQIRRDDGIQLQFANINSEIARLQAPTILPTATHFPTTSTTTCVPAGGVRGAGTAGITSSAAPATGTGTAATASAAALPTAGPGTAATVGAAVATGAVSTGAATAATVGTSGTGIAGTTAGVPPGATTTVRFGGAVPGTTATPAGASQQTTATSGGTPGVGPGMIMSGKDIKIPVLPLLGRPPNALPYVKWVKSVKIKLAAIGAGAVLNPNWIPSTPEEQIWWNTVNPLVFSALYDAITRYDTLSDNISRFCDDEGSGRLAWNAIKAFHVKLAEGNRETLMLDLNGLVPGDNESMESFLCRCNNLREKFLEYNLVLEDSLLISHLFGHIDPTWRWMSGFAEIPTDVLTWEDVSSALQKQDNQRRQGQKQNPLILPLGWVPKDIYQKSKIAAAHSAQGNKGAEQDQDSNEEASANAAQGSTKWKGHKKPHPGKVSTSDSPHTSFTGKPSQFFICFCCFEFGHGCNDCPKRTEGWKVTKEARAKGMALRDAKVAKYGRPRTNPGEQPSSAVL